MKKLVVILFSLLLVTSAFADFTWAQLNMYQGVGIANAFGDTYNDMYFEVEGGGRTGVLDLYYFFDVNTFMGVGDDPQGKQGTFFTKITPRFSLSNFVPEMGPVKELFVATQYKGWNGGADYYAGLGSSLAVPFFERFNANFFMMMEHVDDDKDVDKTKFENAGFVLAINWYTTIYKINEMTNVTYQGWSDYGFSNTYAEDNNNYPEVDKGTADEFQMFNGFFLNYNKWSASASLKLHNHFTYRETNENDAMSYFFGLHRRF